MLISNEKNKSSPSSGSLTVKIRLQAESEWQRKYFKNAETGKMDLELKKII